MSNSFRATNSSLHDYLLKQTRLVFECAITASATPASKVHAVNFPGTVYLRTEGKTSEADAIEDLSATFATATDSTGIFGILIDDLVVTKILKVTVTASTGSVTVVASGISSEGRIYLDLDSNQSLASQSLTLTVEVEYVL